MLSYYYENAHTHFKCFVENTEAPSTLPTTFNNLYAKLVFCVGSKVVDVNIQVGRVDHFLSTAGRAAAGPAAQLVPDCVHAVVGDTLATTETCIGPHHYYCGRRQYRSFDANWWQYGCRRLRN